MIWIWRVAAGIGLLPCTAWAALSIPNEDLRYAPRIAYTECLRTEASKLDDGVITPKILADRLKIECVAEARAYIRSAIEKLPLDQQDSLAMILEERIEVEAIEVIEAVRKSRREIAEFQACLSSREAEFDDGLIGAGALAERINSRCTAWGMIAEGLAKGQRDEHANANLHAAFAKAERREIIKFVRSTRKAKSQVSIVEVNR